MLTQQNREVFLKNVSRALGRETIPTHVDAPDLSDGPQVSMYQDLSQEEVLAMFKNECDTLSIRYREATPDNLADVVMESIADWGGGKMIYPQAPEMEEFGIQAKFDEADGKDGLSFIQWDPTKSREENIDNAQDANLGLTFPSMAIAETGTLVQPMSSGSGRSVGLLPITHIAVVRRSSIVPRMTQSMANLAEQFRQDPANFPSSVIHISGPSSTVDIELVRVVGVHGPINLTYIILND